MTLFAVFGANAFGQSLALPQPVAVVKDADGKVLGQLAGVDGAHAIVVVNIEGVPGCFVVNTKGPKGYSPSNTLYFSGPGCSGSAYVLPQLELGIEEMTGVKFVVLGPDPTWGTYRVFRSTSNAPAMVDYASFQFTQMDCQDALGTSELVTAVEVSPNPLGGFHGPTLANPEHTWTLTGGDRIQ